MRWAPQSRAASPQEHNHIFLYSAKLRLLIVNYAESCSQTYAKLSFFLCIRKKLSLPSAAVMPASLYQSNFNMERIANFEDTNSAATVKLALELASFGSNFMGFDSGDLQLGQNDHLSLGSGPTLAQLDEKARKSQNMTECVPVPTSEHVAEIVGRQGEWGASY